MSRSCVLVVFASLVLLPPATSWAQSQRCDTVLMQRTVHAVSESKRTAAAWMKLVNSDKYEEMRRDADASLTGFFDGSYSDFAAKRAQFFSKENYRSDDFQARQELRVALPPGAVDAWRQCVLQDATELLVWIDDVDASGATLGIRWKPGLGLGSLGGVGIDLLGVKPGSPLAAVTSLDPGQRTFILQREQSNRSIRGTINGRAGEPVAAFSAKFYVPGLPPANPVVVTETPFPTNWLYGGNPDQATRIFRGEGVAVKLENESRQLSNGELISATRLVASDWGNLLGTIRANRALILWDNGTWWSTRSFSTMVSENPKAAFVGGWTCAGNKSQPCAVSQSGGGISFLNERGSTSAGHTSGNVMVARDWGNLQGKLVLDGSVILWANGTWWGRPR